MLHAPKKEKSWTALTLFHKCINHFLLTFWKMMIIRCRIPSWYIKLCFEDDLKRYANENDFDLKVCWQDLETQSKQRGNRSGPAAHLQLSERESFLGTFSFFQRHGQHIFFGVWKRSVHTESPRGINSLARCGKISTLLFPERWENQVAGESIPA